MDGQELEAFLTLSEELHFGRTADRLFVSRARISQLIQSLERRVGAPLFERTSRRVVLTPIGQQLREGLGPHVDGIHRALAKAADSARGIGGTLRVGFSSPRASELVVRIMADFRARHPDCDVQIREVHRSDRYGAVRRGELDMLLIEFPVDEPDLVTGPVLFSDERVWCTSHWPTCPHSTTASPGRRWTSPRWAASSPGWPSRSTRCARRTPKASRHWRPRRSPSPPCRRPRSECAQ
ncbi:LysR family transcriptional regulator [Nocardia cyriacigeorgica]|uniref:LysR family transcriptional regulator n=1 Tax=Nocardia cyriacigeorgica TaxID=135487 RepID=A0A6P1DAQ4_9NOCA|nr:LysR family transcriptional regulator [Nocardia cyriacigeorgica]NEW47796.1 LysR family transcriptional regulator [Nocardia cyriacigeorgica]